MQLKRGNLKPSRVGFWKVPIKKGYLPISLTFPNKEQLLLALGKKTEQESDPE